MPSLHWNNLLRQLELVILECGSQKIEKSKDTILSLLRRYEADESDFKKYIFYNKQGYTKNLVKNIGSECNVIVMCWAPNQSSAFHSHEGSKCFVKVLWGQLLEQQVACPQIDKPASMNPSVESQFSKTLEQNDVTYIDDSIGAHKVINMSNNRPAITLHIYCPPYKKCRIFDAYKDDKTTAEINLSIERSQIADVTFQSEFGNKTNLFID